MPTKVCTDCKTEKDASQFSLVNKHTGQRRPQCNPCKLAREKAQAEARRAADGPKPEYHCCTKCGEKKLFDSSNFKTSKLSPFGLRPECKSCNSARNREWAKTEKAKEVKKRFYKNNAEKLKLYAKEYQQKNRKRISEYVKVWRSKNIEHYRMVDAEWSRKNKAKRTEYRHKRRAAGEFSYAVIPELMQKQNGKCTVCRGFLTKLIEIDHIIPVALGGTNEKTNLQLLCRPCNRSKGAKHPVDFMQSRGFLL